MAGLRDRKKEETRQRISDAARRLFLAHGFDAVTMANVAEQADVSPATVFNYFRTKEELFFSGLHAFEAQLVAAVRDRSRGVSVLEAFRQHLLSSTGNLAARGAANGIAAAARVITSSASLLNQERGIVAQHTDELAAVLRGEAGVDEVEAQVVANALMGVHAAVVAHARRLALGGATGRALADPVRKQAERAFGRLERGLGALGA